MQSLDKFVAKFSEIGTRLQERVSKQLKNLGQDAVTKPVSFELSFVEGGSMVFLVLPANADTFAIATAMRSALCTTFSKFENTSIHFWSEGLAPKLSAKVFPLFASHLKILSHKASKIQNQKKPAPARTLQITVAASSVDATTKKSLQSTYERALIVADANNLVRDLAELPPNFLTPSLYVKKVKEIAKTEKDLEVEFLDETKLAKMGAGAFLAVVAAKKDDGAGIVRLRYKPRGKSRGKIALVGKGLCFDTGGYNIKPDMHMRGMKQDMTGSAVALASLLAAKRLQIPVEIEAFLAIAENHLSPDGFKADDVVTALNGKTIEIVHTDAEGRMVLSDTLSLAAGTKPDLILDYATLTGSVRRALDTRRSGVYSNRDSLLRLAQDAGDATGERIWPFPSGEDYREPLESEVADLLQCLDEGMADHIYAATFLREFVGEEVPWVHVDLAASTNKGGLGLVPTKTTGFGVFWTIEMIERFFKLEA